MSEAAGFAVIERGRLLIATVAARDIDAMIHWLDGMMSLPFNPPDSLVRRSFSQCAERKQAEVVPVIVSAGRRPAVRRVDQQPEAEEGEY